MTSNLSTNVYTSQATGGVRVYLRSRRRRSRPREVARSSHVSECSERACRHRHDKVSILRRGLALRPDGRFLDTQMITQRRHVRLRANSATNQPFRYHDPEMTLQT